MSSSTSAGSLWSLIERRMAEARAAGALLPIPTQREAIEEAGVPFEVRVVDSLRRKAEARRAARAYAQTTGTAVNPFLPYDPALLVRELDATHVCLFNKFPVLERHLLIVTRAFAPQQALLDEADFVALWRCLAEVDGLGFYNGGEEAGASQPHKHLQLVPLPLTSIAAAQGRGARVPIEALFDAPLPQDQLHTLDGLPLRHALAGLPPDAHRDPVAAARRSLALYDQLLAAVGLAAVRSAGQGRQAGPYNLLLTREWMLVVPRRREHFETISFNALGFAGSLFVRDAAELARVRQVGPLAMLRSVGVEG